MLHKCSTMCNNKKDICFNKTYMIDLKKFRNWLNVTQQEFSDAISMDRVKLSRLENSSNPLKKDLIDQIKKIYPVEFEDYLKEINSKSEVSESSTGYGSSKIILEMLQENNTRLEKCHSEKEELLKRIAELEKQLIVQEKTIKVKPGQS